MTGKNQEHIQAFAETVFKINRESIMNTILEGTFNLDDFVESKEDAIRKELHENWESFVGTGNPYWDRENISDSDLKFMIGRIKHDLCLKLPELIKADLKEKYRDAQLQYVKTLSHIKELLVSLCERADIGTSRDLVDLQVKVVSLQSIASHIEKIRLFFTAQQLKIDPVTIPTLSMPQELFIRAVDTCDSVKGHSEIATAVTSFTPAHEDLTPKETAVSVGDGNSASQQAEPGTSNIESDADSEIGTIHIFERTLVNGFVRTVKHTPAIVPEKQIREKGFEHGDKLRVVKTRQVGEKVHYEFELAEKGNVPPTTRVQISMCIVEKDEDGLFVEKAASGQTKIIVDGTARKIHLKEHDITRLKICDGDIVDIAFWPKDPENARVVWKHYT